MPRVNGSDKPKVPKVRESRVGIVMPIALNTEEAERFLGLGSGYLREYRQNGSRNGGRPAPPRHIKLDPGEGGKVIYMIEDLIAWAKGLPRIETP